MKERYAADHVIVRSFRPADAEHLHAAVRESIDEVAPYETWCHAGYTLDEASEYVDWWIEARERRMAYYYVVEDKKSEHFLGVCGLSDYSTEHRHAMLGYWIRTSWTGRGVATQAARRVCEAGFSDLDLIRISIMVPIGNPASGRVARKLGATQEGLLRSELILPAGPTNVIAYGLLAGELVTA